MIYRPRVLPKRAVRSIRAGKHARRRDAYGVAPPGIDANVLHGVRPLALPLPLERDEQKG